MTAHVKDLIERRISTNYFNSRHQLTDEQIRELIGLATKAPSRLQFSELTICRPANQLGKEQLKSVAYSQ